MAGMAGNGWKWMEWLEMNGIAGKGLKQLKVAGNEWKWMEMTGNCWKFWQWLKMG